VSEPAPARLVLRQHPQAAALVARRARLLAALRAHLDGRGLVEAQVPALLPHAGQETHLHPPAVRLAGLPGPLWLQTSPELCLKRLVCAGLPRVYALGAAYRGGREEVSRLHQPEFCMLEWYRPGNAVEELIADVRALGVTAAEALGVAAPPAGRALSVEQAFREHAGADLHALPADGGNSFARLLLERVEPALAAEPGWVFLHGFPASGAALAQLSPADPRVALRVEAYLRGTEIANGYVELADPEEHRRRWAAERAARAAGGEAELPPLDAGLLASLAAPGLPPTVGMALGVDRLEVALLGARGLADVLPFRLELEG
jgi:elongation factor P--(R)-beta-lysine ligase